MADFQSEPTTDEAPGEDAYPHIYVKDTDAALPPYQTIGFGRYSDFQPLATGGSAVLRACRDKILGRTVVMKTLHPHLSGNDYMQARFLREARVTAQLQHPTTVPVYDLGRDMEDRLYFTMKKVEGRTVRKIVELQAGGDAKALEEFDLEPMLNVLFQLTHGLSYAHAHGVVHRDVKPENVLVGAFGEVVLLDWGVAKVWADEGSEGAAQLMEHQVLTDVNQRPGTPLYMSPEQVRGGGADIDARTDVYSVGALLYEVLTLQEPLRGKRVQDTFEMIVNEMPVPPRERAPTRRIPPELADICMKAMAKRPEDRFATMEAMSDALRDFRSRALESLPSG